MAKETEEGNKLIAEFGGWTFHTDPTRSKRWRKWWATEGIVYAGISPPPFDTEWNFLMPVVEKIAKLGYRVKTNFNSIDNSVIIQHMTDSEQVLSAMYYSKPIDATHTAVIQFITWYNQNK